MSVRPLVAALLAELSLGDVGDKQNITAKQEISASDFSVMPEMVAAI